MRSEQSGAIELERPGAGGNRDRDDEVAHAAVLAARKEVDRTKTLDRVVQVIAGVLSIVAIILFGVAKTDIDKANTKIAVLNLALANSEFQVDLLKATLATLNAAELKRQFLSLNDSATSLTTATATETAKLELIQANISAIGNIAQRFSNLESGASAVSSRVGSLESSNASTLARVASVESSVTSLQSISSGSAYTVFPNLVSTTTGAADAYVEIPSLHQAFTLAQSRIVTHTVGCALYSANSGNSYTRSVIVGFIDHVPAYGAETLTGANGPNPIYVPLIDVGIYANGHSTASRCLAAGAHNISGAVYDRSGVPLTLNRCVLTVAIHPGSC